MKRRDKKFDEEEEEEEKLKASEEVVDLTLEVGPPLQLLLSLPDVYAQDLSSLLDTMSAKEKLSDRDIARYLTDIHAIEPRVLFKKAVSFCLPPEIPALDRFFSRLASSMVLQIQVSQLLRGRKELFVATKTKCGQALVKAWAAVKGRVADRLAAIPRSEGPDIFQ